MATFREYLGEDREYLKEAVDVIAKIEKMTDWNDHQGARIEGAKYLKDKKLQKAYEGIQAIHSYFGDMSYEQIDKIRSMLDKKMWILAKKKLKPEEYERFTGAY